MYRKLVNYVDYNGNSRSEEFNFHLTKPKLTRLFAEFYPELAKRSDIKVEDYRAIIAKIIDGKDPNELVDMFETIILRSFGIKSDDGLSFQQSEELSNRFANTAAYDALFTDLFLNPDEMMKFFDAIIPSDMKEVSNVPARPQSQPAVGLQKKSIPFNPANQLDIRDTMNVPQSVINNPAGGESVNANIIGSSNGIIR